jgi:mannosyltransferase
VDREAAVRVTAPWQWTGAVRAVAALAVLAAASALARTAELGIGFWIDEGLSVGIADRPFLDIPGVLRQDGSPPLYYLLLHGWMALAGRGEEATRTLSLVFALAAVPVGWWVARELFGPRAGWFAAVLYAFAPFLTHYAQEARMYALVVLLGTLACGTFGMAFVQRRRGAIAGFAVAVAALLYTHNWGVFAAGGLGVAWLGLCAAAPPQARRALLRDGLLGFGGAALLYAPWVPSAVFQAANTGAPWARAPSLRSLGSVPGQLVGDYGQIALAVGALAGFHALWRARGPRARAAAAVGGAGVAALLAAWAASQVNPAWAVRYLAAVLPFLLLALAAGLAHAGRLGVLTAAFAVALWGFGGAPSDKSNARDVAEAVAPALAPGDVVLSTQPEQVPVLAYYLPDDLAFATLWGPLNETGVTDWRDGVERLRATSAGEDLEPVVDRLEPGRRLVLVEPVIYDLARWSAPWTELVRVRSMEWRTSLDRDPRLIALGSHPVNALPRRPNPVRATVYVRERMR